MSKLGSCHCNLITAVRTMHLLLGNSERLLTNFIEVLVQDACPERGLVRTTGVRTIEAFILEGLTGRFNLGIIIPKNLLPDGAATRIYNPYSEAAQAIRVLKKRCSMPIIAAAAVEEHSIEVQMLRAAGIDGLVELPFHPDQFAAAIHEVVNRKSQQEVRKPDLVQSLLNSLSSMSHCVPARAT